MSTPPNAMTPRALDVQGALDLEGPGCAARLTASGREITVEVPSVASLFRLASGGPARRSRARRLEALRTWLEVADLRVVVRVAGRTVARLDASSRPTVLSRLLGVGPMAVTARRGNA